MYCGMTENWISPNVDGILSLNFVKIGKTQIFGRKQIWMNSKQTVCLYTQTFFALQNEYFSVLASKLGHFTEYALFLIKIGNANHNEMEFVMIGQVP